MAVWDPTLSRRALLGGMVLLAAGCRHRAPVPVLDPDAAALAAARDAELRLIGLYDAVIASDHRPASTFLSARADHVAHLSALGGRPPSTTPLPNSTPVPFATPMVAAIRVLTDTERASATALQAAAVRAVHGTNAALLASVAAAHAAHATLSFPLLVAG